MLTLSSILFGLAIAALADTQITLGSAGEYGVFGATTITNTGLTVVQGNIGLSPGSSITGFPPGTVIGSTDIDNGAATTAKTDIQNAYNALAALPVNTDLTGKNLGGLTLTSGVYGFSSSGFLDGTLTLDAQGQSNAEFVFKFGSTLITGSRSSVVLINGAQSCNVYWQVGSSATLGTGTRFVGNILAQASITATTGVVVSGGGLYALTAAVTLDDNAINPLGSCGGSIVSASSTITSTASLTISSTASSAVSSAASSTTSPTSSISTVTSLTTTTVTNSASTVTATISAPSTITSTVATSHSTCTSTSTTWSTLTHTTTCPAPTCPATTSAESSSASTAFSSSRKAAMAKRSNSLYTKIDTVTSTCAGRTSTYTARSAQVTQRITHVSTSTQWKTWTSTTTSIATHTPSCTTAAIARRDYQMMFK